MASTDPRTEPDPRLGRPLAEIDTPTLMLDRAASDRNLAQNGGVLSRSPREIAPALQEPQVRHAGKTPNRRRGDWHDLCHVA